MIQRPAGMGAYEFVVISTLRAAQLMRGCTPRIDPMQHKPTTVAQLEVAEGKIVQLDESPPAAVAAALV